MSFPLEVSGVFSGLLCGVIFGVALENAGFASCCKLTGQLRFRDWSVFNVMFTAIIVAAGGLYLLQLLGLMSPPNIYIPTTFVWATLLGGALIGAGMAVGGYCPGTSVVAVCSGHRDGFAFFVGLILGPVLFAGVYDYIKPMLIAAKGPDAQTLSDLLGLPTWAILALLIGVAIVVGKLTNASSDRNTGSANTGSAGSAMSAAGGGAPS